VIVKKAFPPNYEAICAKFDIRGRPGIIFTYGGTIYNPDGTDVSPDLHAHEEVHERQQRQLVGGPDAWWDLYIGSAEFRYSQELEAYRVQYGFAVQHYGRDQRRRVLRHISRALAGPMYGNLMSPDAARRAITS